jgi:hypothetical protein
MKFYIISDCHGNIDGLVRALEKKNLFKNGHRQLSNRHKIISIGDLANCVSNSIGGDLECLNLVGEVIDIMLIGNHEIPYLDQTNSFNGFAWDASIHHKIQTLMNEDFIGASVQVGNTLISHAGISQSILSVDMNVSEIHDVIEENWEARNFRHSWFSSIGHSRGGMNHVGGILWCDFDNEFVPTKFPQIVGHTPKFVRMRDNALCIDVGAKDQETEPFILELV